MNSDNCTLVNANWNSGYIFTGASDCHTIESDGSYTMNTLVNVSKVDIDVLRTTAGARFTICKFDLKGNYVSMQQYYSLPVGTQTFTLAPNYLYKFSYVHSAYDNPKLYKCNTGISSMSNSLAFGSSSFLDSIGVIIPFIIIIIGFAIGYKFLKRIIKSSSKGKASV